MIKLYNTLTRKKEEFVPIKKTVGIYACGPTVYNYAHIGNLRTFIFEDILKRVLVFDKFKVKHVINITDVGHLSGDMDMGEEKLEKAAKRENKSAWEIADFYTKAFKNDIKLLNILPPKIWCKATDHIKEQINLVKILEKKGFTYKTSDGVYFDTSKLNDYGKLAHLDIKGLEEGARVEKNPEKRNLTDFALWKFSPAVSSGAQKRQMEWKSPWGVGFPGWHIECSAMSMKYLGETFDIHCGGIDLVPVHHTNEIAQSESATGKPLAHYWMHGEFIVVKSGDEIKRMGKSVGNFLTLNNIVEKNFNPLAYRYFTLQTHYRKQLQWSEEALQAAQNGLEHLYKAVAELEDSKIGSKTTCAELENKFIERVNDDLDMPGALAIVWELLKSQNPSSAKLKSILKFDQVLGLNIEKERKLRRKPLPSKIKKLVQVRDSARLAKDWSASDALRIEIEKLGYIVEDSKDKTNVVKR